MDRSKRDGTDSLSSQTHPLTLISALLALKAEDST